MYPFDKNISQAVRGTGKSTIMKDLMKNRLSEMIRGKDADIVIADTIFDDKYLQEISKSIWDSKTLTQSDFSKMLEQKWDTTDDTT